MSLSARAGGGGGPGLAGRLSPGGPADGACWLSGREAPGAGGRAGPRGGPDGGRPRCPQRPGRERGGGGGPQARARRGPREESPFLSG